MNVPISYEDDNLLFLYKPLGMYTVPLSFADNKENLLSYAIEISPSIKNVKGFKECEGGCFYRLDNLTQGLVLFAKNQKAFDELLNLKKINNIVKTYYVCAVKKNSNLMNVEFASALNKIEKFCELVKKFNNDKKITIESSFRHFGKKGLYSLPVFDNKDNSKIYKSEIFLDSSIESTFNLPKKFSDLEFFRVNINNAFKHQIRSHLALLGYSVLGDNFYGSELQNDFFGLKCVKVQFINPSKFFKISSISQFNSSLFSQVIRVDNLAIKA